jgi:hypothetical protein
MFPKRAQMGAAWRDFRDFIVAPRPHKIVFVTAALAAPVGLFLAFVQQARVDADYIPPKIVYVQQWTADRTIAQIKAQQAKDLPGEIARKKAQEAKAERQRQVYRKLGETLGIDVDAKRH